MNSPTPDHEFAHQSAIIAYIGLGSNLQNPAQQIQDAMAAIDTIDLTQLLACSSLYRSPPMGPPDQPDYVNAVLAVQTELTPSTLLKNLQAIENDQGRIRQAQRWIARTLDLDILLYADAIINTPDLIVPHYGISERAFVLYPLFEIAPALHIPGKGYLVDLIKQCPLNGLERISE